LGAAALLAAFGVIHAYTLTSAGVVGRIGWWVAPEFAFSYSAGALFLLTLGWLGARHSKQLI
jgi:hypothetical protein